MFLATVITVAITATVRLLHHYAPWIDISKEGDVLLWYNDHEQKDREFIRLFNIHL